MRHYGEDRGGTVKNRLVWAVWPGLALLVACSVEEGRSPRSPVSGDWPEAVSSAVTASELSCTLTQGFWKNHPEAWPVEEVLVGAESYTKERALEILSTSPARGDATYILAHQLIAAKLNALSGADDPTVAATITEADAWLTLHPLGSNPTGADREAGIVLAEVLDDYNNGAIGPGPCEEAPFPTPTPSPTPSPDPTPFPEDE